MSRRLTHLDAKGRARMVDVGSKRPTKRSATATAEVTMEPATLALIVEGGHAKGDVLGTARIAGIMAAKHTHELIPLCHPLPLNAVEVKLACNTKRNTVEIEATCRTLARTGVEMEALTAAAVAGLTVYDMCKAVDRKMEIGPVRLIHKAGGKSGTYLRT